MKTDEMRKIGAMIINVLKNSEDQKVLTHTKDQVAELCKAFPLYS
jgi:glycine/serine hydroxymethyltransferase